MQVPGAGHLRLEHAIESVAFLARDELIVEDGRGMEDAPERLTADRNVVDHASHGGRVGDVAAGIDDRRSSCAKAVDNRARFVIGSGAAHQHQVTAAAIGDPLRDAQADAAGAAGDEVGGIRPEAVRRG